MALKEDTREGRFWTSYGINTRVRWLELLEHTMFLDARSCPDPERLVLWGGTVGKVLQEKEVYVINITYVTIMKESKSFSRMKAVFIEKSSPQRDSFSPAL